MHPLATRHGPIDRKGGHRQQGLPCEIAHPVTATPARHPPCCASAERMFAPARCIWVTLVPGRGQGCEEPECGRASERLVVNVCTCRAMGTVAYPAETGPQHSQDSDAQSFIHAATRFPAKRLANRSPVVPMGKYEIIYHSSATSCAMAAMRVRIVWCNCAQSVDSN